ncbi:MAG: hypothetical protein K5744_05465 [Eubacterium sp.]|jgi:hypothetical protein|nr:hypothetical protein [Eubacterium sp.]
MKDTKRIMKMLKDPTLTDADIYNMANGKDTSSAAEAIVTLKAIQALRKADPEFLEQVLAEMERTA